MKKFFPVLAALLILIESCKSTTMISSTPAGAKVYMNEELKGTTPLKYSDTKISGAKTNVRIEADGYEPLSVVLKRNERASAGAIVGGLFVLIPFIWTMQYNKTHMYELKPKGTAGTTTK